MPGTTITAPHADELLLALARLEETLNGVRRAAGDGCSPAHDRQLHAHLRSLRALLGQASSNVVEDVVDAARRVLEAADPAAPLMVLGMAQRTLTGLLRRHAALQALPTAA